MPDEVARPTAEHEETRAPHAPDWSAAPPHPDGMPHEASGARTLRVLGEGGTDVVHEAEPQAPQRRVGVSVGECVAQLQSRKSFPRIVRRRVWVARGVQR